MSDSSRFRCYGTRNTNYSFTAIGTGADANTESTALQKAPFSVIGSGYYGWSSGGLGRGSVGNYWFSHTYASSSARYLYFDASGFYPQGGNSRLFGFTVRCVVR